MKFSRLEVAGRKTCLNPLQEVGVMKCWLREALLLLTCLLLLRTATTTGPPKDWRRGYFTRFPLKNQ